MCLGFENLTSSDRKKALLRKIISLDFLSSALVLAVTVVPNSFWVIGQNSVVRVDCVNIILVIYGHAVVNVMLIIIMGTWVMVKYYYVLSNLQM